MNGAGRSVRMVAAVISGIKNMAELSITDVSAQLGICPKTIRRFEKSGDFPSPKRNWKGWRVYNEQDLRRMRKFFSKDYDLNTLSKPKGI